MAQFTVDLQNLKQSFPDMDLLNNLSEASNQTLHTNEPIGLSNHQEFSLLHKHMNFHNEGIIIPSSSVQPCNVPVYDHLAHFYSPTEGDQIHEVGNANKLSESGFLAVNSIPSLSGSELDNRVKKSHNGGSENYSGKKRKKNNDKEMEKPAREVVHVRAKRGQATDSHSLAERLRREKINEKLRCLQDLVPGCYKTMGMAVMLDVIINYVRSLQNQIDFLSMKLSAASLYCDFNSPEIDNMQPVQGSNNPYDANGSERMVGEGYGGFPHHVQTSWPL
ncbi:hypothetical protein Leryth_005866 [Lithospermum erythrorhizon]|nr:hypothetical protein Leryth_005866 [Lithospermum erythrorhizon]